MPGGGKSVDKGLGVWKVWLGWVWVLETRLRITPCSISRLLLWRQIFMMKGFGQGWWESGLRCLKTAVDVCKGNAEMRESSRLKSWAHSGHSAMFWGGLECVVSGVKRERCTWVNFQRSKWLNLVTGLLWGKEAWRIENDRFPGLDDQENKMLVTKFGIQERDQTWGLGGRQPNSMLSTWNFMAFTRYPMGRFSKVSGILVQNIEVRDLDLGIKTHERSFKKT